MRMGKEGRLLTSPQTAATVEPFRDESEFGDE